MAREELGTKRVCPETLKKFYDLNRDPVVSPYTGKSYPLSFFEEIKAAPVAKSKPAPEEELETDDTEELDTTDDVVSLDDADDDVEAADDKNLPDLGDNTDDEIVIDDDDDDDDTFLADDDEDDDDMIGIIDVKAGKDDES